MHQISLFPERGTAGSVFISVLQCSYVLSSYGVGVPFADHCDVCGEESDKLKGMSTIILQPHHNQNRGSPETMTINAEPYINCSRDCTFQKVPLKPRPRHPHMSTIELLNAFLNGIFEPYTIKKNSQAELPPKTIIRDQEFLISCLIVP